MAVVDETKELPQWLVFSPICEKISREIEALKAKRSEQIALHACKILAEELQAGALADDDALQRRCWALSLAAAEALHQYETGAGDSVWKAAGVREAIVAKIAAGALDGVCVLAGSKLHICRCEHCTHRSKKAA